MSPLDASRANRTFRRILCCLLATGALLSLGPAARGQAPPPRPRARAGETVRLPDNVTLLVEQGNQVTPSDVPVTGQAFVVTVRLEAGSSPATIAFYPAPDPMNSGVALVAGDVRIAPVGVIESFPGEPRKVTLVKSLKLAPPFDQGVLARTLGAAGAVTFVFDLGPGQSKAKKALVVDLTVNARSQSLFVEIDKW